MIRCPQGTRINKHSSHDRPSILWWSGLFLVCLFVLYAYLLNDLLRNFFKKPFWLSSLYHTPLWTPDPFKTLLQSPNSQWAWLLRPVGLTLEQPCDVHWKSILTGISGERLSAAAGPLQRADNMTQTNTSFGLDFPSWVFLIHFSNCLDGWKSWRLKCWQLKQGSSECQADALPLSHRPHGNLVGRKCFCIWLFRIKPVNWQLAWLQCYRNTVGLLRTSCTPNILSSLCRSHKHIGKACLSSLSFNFASRQIAVDIYTRSNKTDAVKGYISNKFSNVSSKWHLS